MFSKKFFSLFILVLAVNIKLVCGTDVKLSNCEGISGPDYDNCDSTKPPDTFCIHTDNKIYGVETTGNECTPALGSGLHVFKVTTAASDVKKFTLGTHGIVADDASKIVMYACNNDGCAQTSGYAKIDTYTLIGDEGNYDPATSFKLDADTITFTAAAAGDTWAGSTYYTKANGFYKINGEGGASAVDVECAEAKVGSFHSTAGVCLGKKLTGSDLVTKALSGSDSFILTGTLSDAVFAYPSSHDAIIVTQTTNAIYHNNSPTTSYEPKVYNLDTKILANPSSNLSNDAAKLGLFQCKSGACIAMAGYLKDSNKYYGVAKAGGATSVTFTDPINLSEENYCNESVGLIVKDSSGNYYLCITADLGVKVPDTTGSLALGTPAGTGSSLTASKLIKLTPNFIYEESFSGEETDYIFKFGENDFHVYTYGTGAFTFKSSVNGVEAYSLLQDYTTIFSKITNLLGVTEADKSTILLLKCVGGKCQKTDGYVSIATNKIYKCTSGACTTEAGATEKSESCDSDNLGKLKFDSNLKLCNSNFMDIDGNVYFIGTTSYKMYIGNASKTAIGMPTPENGYYLIKDNKAITTGDGDTLIVCNNGSCTGTAVASLTLADKSYFIDQNSYDPGSAKFTRIISCTDKNGANHADTCSILTIEAGIYINASVSTLTNALISCADESGMKCELISAQDGDYYLNALTGSKFLIECSTSGGCKKVTSPDTTNTYLDYETLVEDSNPKEYTSLITCSNADTCSSTVVGSGDAGYHISAESTSKIISCTESECILETSKVGYYTNADGDLIKCSGNPISCEDYTKNSNECNTNIISQIDTNDKLCLDSTGDTYIVFDTDGTPDYALINYDTNSIFTDVPSDKYGLIKATTYSLSIDTSVPSICVDENFAVTTKNGVCNESTIEYSCFSGICIEKTEDGTPYSAKCDITNGTNCKDDSYLLDDVNHILYYCEKQNNPCQPVSDVGYFIVDASTAYYCTIDSTLECHAVNEITKSSKCTDELIGELVSIGDQLSFCLTRSTAVSLTNANKGIYVVAGKSGDIFGIDSSSLDYGIVNVDEKLITLNTKYTNNMKYVYVDKTDTGKYKVLERTSTCPTTKDSESILELECQNGLCDDVDAA